MAIIVDFDSSFQSYRDVIYNYSHEKKIDFYVFRFFFFFCLMNNFVFPRNDFAIKGCILPMIIQKKSYF